MIAWPILLPPLCLSLLLLAAGWIDLRTRTIPNGLNIAIAIGAPPWWWAQGLPVWPDVALQACIAAALFIGFAGLFVLRLMGGGDVKMIAAAALWLPPVGVARMLLVMAIAGGILTVAMVAWHRMRRLGGQPEIPYGVAIAVGGLWVMANHILTTSSP